MTWTFVRSLAFCVLVLKLEKKLLWLIFHVSSVKKGGKKGRQISGNKPNSILLRVGIEKAADLFFVQPIQQPHLRNIFTPLSATLRNIFGILTKPLFSDLESEKSDFGSYKLY